MQLWHLQKKKLIIDKGLINKPLQPSELSEINSKFQGLTSGNRDSISRDDIKKAGIEALIDKQNVTLKDLKVKLSAFGQLKTLDVFGYKKSTGNPKRPFSYYIVFTQKSKTNKTE